MLCNNINYEETSEEIELMNIYFKTIDKIGYFFHDLNLDNIHQYFYIFCYLLWNGYFSVNKSYVFNSTNILDENNAIFLGSGCCRQNATLLTSVLRRNDFFTNNLKVHISSYKCNYFKFLDRKIESSRREKMPKDRFNHLVTLVKLDNNICLLLDPTNPCECEILNYGKISSLIGHYKINNDLLKTEIYNDSRLLLTCYPFNNKRTLSKKEILDDYEIAKEICHQKRSLIEDFYVDNHPDYENIRRLVLKKDI